MALAISATGTIDALPLAPYDLSDQGGTIQELHIPRGAYDARASVQAGLYGYEELMQFIGIIADAYNESSMSVIVHFHRMLNTLIRDRNTGEG